MSAQLFPPCRKELESVLMHPRFRSYLRVRGIDIHDANLFYRMMTSVVGDESQDIDLHFVVAACLRMKGAASSMDLHALTFESKLLNKKHRLWRLVPACFRRGHIFPGGGVDMQRSQCAALGARHLLGVTRTGARPSLTHRHHCWWSVVGGQ